MNQSVSEPLVSVCIQTYQHAAFIKECLDSVLMQETDFPFEIILGEDDSTDGTREICIDYAERYPHIIKLFLRSEKDKIFINGEKTGRFNYIENLKAASGKYIALLDGDDYWISKDKLQKQADFMQANPDCSMCFHKIMWDRVKGRLFEKKSKLPSTDTKFTLDDLLEANIVNTASCMFRKNNIEEIPEWFFQVPFLDYPLNLHNAQKGKIGFLAETMAVYRIHPGGMWSSKQAPGNLIRLWHLYGVIARNVNGKVRTAMQARRFKTGNELIGFYQTHLWESKKWMKEELECKEFAEDEILLKRLEDTPALKNYFLNSWFFSKKIFRKILKGS